MLTVAMLASSAVSALAAEVGESLKVGDYTFRKRVISMKKVLILICILLIIPSVYVFAQNFNQCIAEIVTHKIIFNNKEVSLSNPIVSINNRVYVSIRDLSETLGYNVEWQDSNHSININLVEKDDNENLIIFKQNQKMGFMDRTGKIQIAAQFDVVHEFHEGIAVVGNHISTWEKLPSDANNMIWGFIDEYGELITPIKYSYAGDFNEGLALVEYNNESYYINKLGEKSSQTVIASKYFTHGIAPKLIKGTSFPTPNSPSEIWTYIDSAGELVTDKTYEYAGEFEDGMAIVKQNGKYGVINNNFNIVIDCQYNNLKKISNNLYAACNGNGSNWGIIDLSNNVIADFIYFDIGCFSNGLAPVRMDLYNGAYINESGKIVFCPQFSMVYDFSDGVACVVDKVNGKAGVIDMQGKYIIEPKYNSLRPCKGGLFETKDDNQNFFYINKNGEKILPH